MPKKGHNPEQIIQALSRAKGGERVAEICRKIGISEASFYM